MSLALEKHLPFLCIPASLVGRSARPAVKAALLRAAVTSSPFPAPKTEGRKGREGEEGEGKEKKSKQNSARYPDVEM